MHRLTTSLAACGLLCAAAQMAAAQVTLYLPGNHSCYDAVRRQAALVGRTTLSPDAGAWGPVAQRRRSVVRYFEDARQPSRAERIEQALSTPVDLDFDQVQLQEAIDDLKERCGIEIQIDRRALFDVGVGTDTPITKHLRGISLKAALKHLARDFGLTCVVQDDYILFTTQAEARRHLETRSYK